LGKLSNPRVKVPVHSCEHHYTILKPFGIAATAPIIHDYDGHIYIRYYDGGGLLFGGFEKEGKPIFHENTPKDFDNKSLKADLDHFCKDNLTGNYIESDSYYYIYIVE
jgi:pyruvate dehydrogenase phosphatase regulatory subunit